MGFVLYDSVIDDSWACKRPWLMFLHNVLLREPHDGGEREGDEESEDFDASSLVSTFMGAGKCSAS
jgi:hypothetical protein